MSLRIVQLTDLHLFRDAGALHAGISTWSTFRAVLDQMVERHGDFDYLVLTGDLAQDEAEETYFKLREALGEWANRCCLIPGNHDDRASLRRVFPDLVPRDGPVTFSLRTGGWHLIGLDSQNTGQVEGRIDAAQLDWLASELAAGGGAPTMIFVHHPPVPVGVDWLDRIGLAEPAALLELIAAAPQVQAVCAGHVHREFAGRIGATAMYTTPSTCAQFSALEGTKYDTAQPGYRTFILDDGGVRTEVHRLDSHAPG